MNKTKSYDNEKKTLHSALLMIVGKQYSKQTKK